MRVDVITESLPLDGRGLEVAPLFRPVLKKPQYNIDYTDYLSTKDLRKRDQSHPDIGSLVEIDFIWTPGKRLKECAGDRVYDYVISSHVWEHVPNPIGWLEQILEVCRPGAIISMALPTKYNPIDFIRREVDISEWVGNYLENRSVPSAKQVFDCLYNVRQPNGPCNKSLFTPEKFAALPSDYSLKQAMAFAHQAATQNTYIDVHCSVFRPETFPELIAEIKKMELLNIDLMDVSLGGVSIDVAGEFFIKLRKPGKSAPLAIWNNETPHDYVSKWVLRRKLKQTIKNILGDKWTGRLKRAAKRLL